ncbi:MAG: Hsp33 family molecular chaperone HslO [Bacilli bacterium]
MNNDYLVRALAFDGQVRILAARTTDVVRESQERHDTWRTASAALGRTLTGALLMGGTLKGEQRVTIKVAGGGPIGYMLVDADAKGITRGYVQNPHVDFEANERGKLRVGTAVGTDGFFSVVKDLGLRENFTGQVPLVTGEIGEEFTHYFAESEQTPSSVAVGVLVNGDHTIAAAGGFLLQLMPNVTEEVISYLEKHLATVPPVSSLIEKGYTPEMIIETVVPKEEVKYLDSYPVQFQCTCSEERVSGALIGLGRTELETIIEEDGKAELHCSFCNKTYTFTKDDLLGLLEQAE